MLLSVNWSDKVLQYCSIFSFDQQIVGSIGGSVCFGYVVLYVGVELGFGDQVQDEVVVVLEVYMRFFGVDCRVFVQS